MNGKDSYPKVKFKTFSASGEEVAPLEAQTLEEFLNWVKAQTSNVIIGEYDGEWSLQVYDDYIE